MIRATFHAATLALLAQLAAPPAAPADDPLPLLVTGMVHIDPIQTQPDSNAAIASYTQHRNAFLWYVGLAQQTGLRLSAQMTGPYAEACVRRHHESDFGAFMPGGPHHLGTHLHANVKSPGAYLWRTLPQSAYANPDSVRLVMSDNTPWVNSVFAGNGYGDVDNDFFHGTHATYSGMDTVLWCPPTPVPVPYSNCYTMAGSRRGWLWIHQGGFATEPAQSPDTGYVKLPEIGGIIGFDQLHGPEGMVYGTVPYQQRDFLRAYLEWREMVRRGERSAVRHFNWMIHPYQLLTQVVGTDGRPPRASIVELVDWLSDNFIGRADESGHVMARWANADEIHDAYDAWRLAHLAEHAALQATLAASQKPLYLPAIYDRLGTCFYLARTPSADTALVLHQLEDRVTGAAVFVAWSRGGTRPLEPTLHGSFHVLHGDGTTEDLPSSAIAIGMEPVVLEFASVAGVSAAPAARIALGPAAPNPAGGWARVAFTLSAAADVRLSIHDLAGREVAVPASGRFAAGAHARTLDTARLAPGLYAVRLEADGRAVARKLVVTR